MEFGKEKRVICVMKRRKTVNGRTKLLNLDRIRILGEKENCKYLGEIGSGRHQTSRDES